MLKFTLHNQHVASEQHWVYVWIHPTQRIVYYVGATWLHPIARAELHLHGDSPQMRVVGEQLDRLEFDPALAWEIMAVIGLKI